LDGHLVSYSGYSNLCFAVFLLRILCLKSFCGFCCFLRFFAVSDGLVPLRFQFKLENRETKKIKILEIDPKRDSRNPSDQMNLFTVFAVSGQKSSTSEFQFKLENRQTENSE